MLTEYKESKILDLESNSVFFSCGFVNLFGRALDEFKFPGSSTIWPDTVVGLEPALKKNIYTWLLKV